MFFFVNSLLFNIIFCVVIIVFGVYKYLTYNKSYWKGKNVRIRDTSSYLNLWKILSGKSSIGKLYQESYKKFENERYIAGFRGRVPELIICDPELIRHVLVKDFQYFPERNNEFSDEVEKLNANLFTVNGARWKAMRQKFTPAFTSGKLRNMFPLVVEKAEEFQRFISKEVQISEELEIRELMSRFTTDVIGSIAFGIEMGSIENVNTPFRMMGRKIVEVSPLKMLKVIFRQIFPQIYNLLKMRILTIEEENFFINIVSEIVKQRVSYGIIRNDFIQLMLELKEKGYIKVDGKNGEERIEFSDIFMTAQAFIFFIAGFETSSAVMSFTMYELAQHPDVQEKLIAEINRVLEKHNGILSYDSVIEMEYLECTINETMRKYPALGNLTRGCISKYTFPDTDLTIDEGVQICIPTLALHYDPKYFPDPHKYMPERFLPEAKQQRHPMVFLPFGEGPRNCIGLRFGKMQSMIGIASILSKFSVHKSPKTEKKVIINTRTFATSPKNGVWLKLKPRIPVTS